MRIMHWHVLTGSLFITVLVVALLLATVGNGLAFSVQLQWDPNSEADLAGYKVYCSADSTATPMNRTGAQEGDAPISIYGSSTNSAVVSGLDPGRTYYLAVTAFNSAGLESSFSNVVVVTLPDMDTTSPVVSLFEIPLTSTTLTVPVAGFAATDNVGVTGYLLTESVVPPSVSDPDWSSSPPDKHLFASPGNKSLYAWVKDAAGNLSNGSGRSVTITLPDTAAPIAAVSPVADVSPPTITFISPGLRNLYGSYVRVVASATDNIAVTKMELYIDGKLKLMKRAGSLSSRVRVANGEHVIMVKAYDAAHNVASSSKTVMSLF